MMQDFCEKYVRRDDVIGVEKCGRVLRTDGTCDNAGRHVKAKDFPSGRAS